MTQDYEYSVVGCAFDIAPILTHVALVSCSDTDVLSIPECLPYQGEWGRNESVSFKEESYHLLPKGIHIIYLSIVERKFYIINESLPIEEINDLWCNGHYDKVVVGMAPYGSIAVWLSEVKKSTLVRWLHGAEIFVDMKSFIPNNPNVSLEQISQYYTNSNSAAKAYYKKYGICPYSDSFYFCFTLYSCSKGPRDLRRRVTLKKESGVNISISGLIILRNRLLLINIQQLNAHQGHVFRL